MGLAIRMAVTVTPPMLIGVLAWWGVMLAAPALLIRRWRRRHHAVLRRRCWLSAVRVGQAAVSPPSPARPRSDVASPGRLAANRARRAEAADPPRLSAGALPRHGQTPPLRSPADSEPAVRLFDETLEPLCRYVDFRRRLELAVAELKRKLSLLRADRWRIESYPLTGERRNTLLLLGETGVFVVSATYAPGHWDDVVAVSRLAGKIQVLLPGYGGPVRPAICHPFTSTDPRIWHRPDEHGEWVGAWLVGGDSVIGWLMHFGPEHGLGAADLARFDQLAKPNWLKGAIPTAPSWPQIHETPSPGLDG
jgi:hypothetical protein